MAGGIVTPLLIKEVSKNGGLGSLPLGYLSIDEARQVIRQTRALTSKKFAVNLFIPSPEESNASPIHQRMILDSPAENTCITSIFTGKPVRSIRNELVSLMEQNFNANEILPYPVQHQITKDLRNKANKSGHLDYAGLWNGQGNPLSCSMSVECLMNCLGKETTAVFSQFQ